MNVTRNPKLRVTADTPSGSINIASRGFFHHARRWPIAYADAKPKGSAKTTVRIAKVTEFVIAFSGETKKYEFCVFENIELM